MPRPGMKLAFPGQGQEEDGGHLDKIKIRKKDNRGGNRC